MYVVLFLHYDEDWDTEFDCLGVFSEREKAMKCQKEKAKEILQDWPDAPIDKTENKITIGARGEFFVIRIKKVTAK